MINTHVASRIRETMTLADCKLLITSPTKKLDRKIKSQNRIEMFSFKTVLLATSSKLRKIYLTCISSWKHNNKITNSFISSASKCWNN